MEDAADIPGALHGAPANDNEPHIGMNGRPCRCTPERRAWYTRGCADTCPCHGLQHAKCPKASPCPGGCGRLTTAHDHRRLLHPLRRRHGREAAGR